MVPTKNKNFAYGEGMENIIGGIRGHGDLGNYQFGSEHAQNGQVAHQAKNIAPIPFSIDGPPSAGGPHNNNDQSSNGGNSFYLNSESKAGHTGG